MATSGSSAFFAELAARLRPLGEKARGMRLTADDWNSLVGVMVDALLKIGRAQDETRAELDRSYAPIHHEHIGEVTHAWLDPALLKEIAEGSGSQAINDRLDALQKQIDDCRQFSNDARAKADSFGNTVAWQETQIIELQNRLNGLDNFRPMLDQVTIRMDAIAANHTSFRRVHNSFKTEVTSLAELRGQLTDAGGAPIDVSGLAQRVTELDSLRDHLAGVDGTPIRVRDLQSQLFELADRPAGGEELDRRLADIRAELTQVEQETEARHQILRGELTTASSEAIAELKAGLDRAAADSRSAAVEATADLVRAAETRLATSFIDEIGTTRTTLAATLRQQAATVVDERLAGLDTRIEGLIGTRATQLSTQLSDQIRTSLDTRLAQGMADATGRIDTKFAEVETRLTATAQSIPQQITQGLASVESTLRTRVDSQIRTKTTAMNEALTRQINQKVTTGINAGLVDVRAASSQAVADRLADLDTRIAASVSSATRTLPDQIAVTVDTRLQQANISGQIDAAKFELRNQLRTEIATTAATLQQNNVTALSSAVVNLRSEFATAPATEAVFRSGTMFTVLPGPG